MSTRKNTLYNMAYRLFSMLLPLVTAPWLSRAVGTEGVGLYGYAWAISYDFKYKKNYVAEDPAPSPRSGTIRPPSTAPSRPSGGCSCSSPG